MIRPFTCFTLLLAAGSGLYLYSAKHAVQLQDREIAKLVRSAQDSRSRAAMLHAEYDLLGDPERLRELSSQVLTLQPTAPTQFTTFAELDRRLPPPGPLPALPEAPAIGLIGPLQPGAVAPQPTAERIAEKPAEKPVERMADRLIERPVMAAQPAAARPPPRPVPAPPPPPPQAMANASPPTASVLAPRPPRPSPADAMPPTRLAPSPQQVVPPVLAQVTPQRRPAATPVSDPYLPPTTPAEAIARVVRGGAVDTSVPVYASALGMARTLMAPPSAIGSAQAKPYSDSQSKPFADTRAQPISAIMPQVRR